MIKSTLKVTFAIVLLASCKQKPADRTENGLTGQLEKAPSGMVYKITHTNDNEKLIQQGQIIKYSVEYRLKSNDSLLPDGPKNKIPEYLPYDTIQFKEVKYNYPEFLGKLRKGDKAEFSLSIDTLEKMNLLKKGLFKKGDFIIGKLDLIDVFANSEMANEDRNKEVKKIKDKLNKPVRDYLDSKKIKNAIETPEGMFVVINEKGDMSNKVDSSKQVSVKYKGYHLNGSVFDPGLQPYLVKIYETPVIYGWHIGLTYFGKGGKGNLYIPSYLAYGEEGFNDIKPNECIAFDIEVLDVKKKEALPKQSAASPR
jgi:FKBP-type peptidyl-prolyl cis-trans isomerase